MKKVLSIVAIFLVTSCVGSLTNGQKQDLKEAKSMYPEYYVEVKNPTAGIALGFVLGFGSFYTENIGVGIANLIFWPLSMFWDPINGYEGSLMINYNESRMKYLKAKSEGKKVPTLFTRW